METIIEHKLNTMSTVKYQRAIDMDNQFTILSKKYGVYITKESYVLLFALHTIGCQNVTHCQKIVNRELSTVSRMLKRLKREKLITTEQNPFNKKKKEVFITERGRSVLLNFYNQLELA